jgi:hypothetical protein
MSKILKNPVNSVPVGPGNGQVLFFRKALRIRGPACWHDGIAMTTSSRDELVGKERSRGRGKVLQIMADFTPACCGDVSHAHTP